MNGTKGGLSMKGLLKRTALIPALFTLVCLGSLSREAGAAEITLRFAGNTPLNHHVTRGQELYARLIGEKTRGKVKVEVYPAGQLFSDRDMVRALPSGAVDMGEINTGMWTGLVPLWVFIDIPFFFKDRVHMHRLFDSEFGEILKQESEKAGIKFLHWIDYGSATIASRVPLKTMEDFKGRRIRGAAETVMEALKVLNAAPVTLGAGEVYMALQRGTIDGAHSGYTSFWERKFYEVIKHVLSVDFDFGTFAVIMNKKKWEELPRDAQEAMLEGAKEVQDWGRKECEKMDKESMRLLKEKGMELYEPPEKEVERLRQACKPLLDLYSKRGGEKGKRLLELGEKPR
jgi:tripartite ATP-independent transporter DctP family solute receptor